MVGGLFWPSTTGEPGHQMTFLNTTIRRVAPCCTRIETDFAVSALRQVGPGARCFEGGQAGGVPASDERGAAASGCGSRPS